VIHTGGFTRRLVLLITSLGRGGAETQLLRLADQLKSRGWEVHLVSIGNVNDFSAELRQLEIHTYTLSSGAALSKSCIPLRLLILFRRLRPHCVIAFMFHANILGRIVGRFAGVPTIFTSIRNEKFGAPWRELLERVTEPLGTKTILNSARVAEALTRKNIVNRSKVAIIPNMVSMRGNGGAFDKLAVRRDVGISGTGFVWLAVGNVRPTKDYENLVQAVLLLRHSGEQFRVLVVGAGPEWKMLQRRVEELDLSDKIVLLGQRRDVDILMGAADGLVLSSAYEGMPNVVMEAFTHRLPVVATDVGGVREIVGHSGAALIVPPRDSAALAAAMRGLMIMTAQERSAMGTAGRRRIEEAYSPDAVVRQWQALLEEACS
jgi:glycosyltransferase involved in cell wall biosynthesis